MRELLRGMSLTFFQLFKEKATINYPFEKGNLFVVFNIEFPTEGLPAAAQEALLGAIPKLHGPVKEAEHDVVLLNDVDPYSSYHDHLPPPPDEDSDDEGGQGGPGGMQCAQS